MGDVRALRIKLFKKYHGITLYKICTHTLPLDIAPTPLGKRLTSMMSYSLLSHVWRHRAPAAHRSRGGNKQHDQMFTLLLIRHILHVFPLLIL